MKTKTAHTDNK